jgi:hypothetical protein
MASFSSKVLFKELSTASLKLEPVEKKKIIGSAMRQYRCEI